MCYKLNGGKSNVDDSIDGKKDEKLTYLTSHNEFAQFLRAISRLNSFNLTLKQNIIIKLYT